LMPTFSPESLSIKLELTAYKESAADSCAVSMAVISM